MNNYCSVFRIMKPGIYQIDEISSAEYLYSDDSMFGNNPLEQLSNFILFCKEHHVPINNIKPFESIQYFGNVIDAPKAKKWSDYGL